MRVLFCQNPLYLCYTYMYMVVLFEVTNIISVNKSLIHRCLCNQELINVIQLLEFRKICRIYGHLSNSFVT